MFQYTCRKNDIEWKKKNHKKDNKTKKDFQKTKFFRTSLCNQAIKTIQSSIIFIYKKIPISQNIKRTHHLTVNIICRNHRKINTSLQLINKT